MSSSSSSYLGATAAARAPSPSSAMPPPSSFPSPLAASSAHLATLSPRTPSHDGSTSNDPAPSSSSSQIATGTSPASSRTRFDPQGTLQSQLPAILSSRLKTQTWDKHDKQRNRSVSRGVAEAVKKRMIEIEPKGFKFIVQVQLVENLGQGGRADLACHWEDSDCVIQDLYSNDTLICTVLCYAIRT